MTVQKTDLKPDFFLIGAPKCGTTAMAQYLAGHPQVYFSDPKEPYYWADDMPGHRNQFGVSTLNDYLRLFEQRSACHSVAGEGSTNYLYSDTAVKRILDFQPNAKFIAMLRQPVDLAYAHFMQQTLVFNEDARTFEAAWELQESRQEGRNLPNKCIDPSLLQYRKVASLGAQVERLIGSASVDNVLLIFFDDFCESPSNSYREILRFLQLTEDGRQEFSKVNAASAPRLIWLRRILFSRQGVNFTRSVKRHLKGPLTGTVAGVKRFLTSRHQSRPALRPEFKQQLVREFADDIQLLSKLSGRDLSAWLD